MEVATESGQGVMVWVKVYWRGWQAVVNVTKQMMLGYNPNYL